MRATMFRHSASKFRLRRWQSSNCVATRPKTDRRPLRSPQRTVPIGFAKLSISTCAIHCPMWWRYNVTGFRAAMNTASRGNLSPRGKSGWKSPRFLRSISRELSPLSRTMHIFVPNNFRRGPCTCFMLGGFWTTRHDNELTRHCLHCCACSCRDSSPTADSPIGRDVRRRTIGRPLWRARRWSKPVGRVSLLRRRLSNAGLVTSRWRPVNTAIRPSMRPIWNKLIGFIHWSWRKPNPWLRWTNCANRNRCRSPPATAWLRHTLWSGVGMWPLRWSAGRMRRRWRKVTAPLFGRNCAIGRWLLKRMRWRIVRPRCWNLRPRWLTGFRPLAARHKR